MQLRTLETASTWRSWVPADYFHEYCRRVEPDDQVAIRYHVGAHWFPAANIRLGDLQSAILKCGADPASLVVVEHDLPSHARQGYEGMLLACGQTRISK